VKLGYKKIGDILVGRENIIERITDFVVDVFQQVINA
jgi:hypothetical protein